MRVRRALDPYIELLAAHGLCTRCKTPVSDGRTCPACRELSRQRAAERLEAKAASDRRRREQLKRRGRCVQCGRGPLETETRCEGCAAAMRKRNAKRMAYQTHHRCSLCGEPGHRRTTCKLWFRVSIDEFASARNAE
jgi:hypothetical protein